jgi:hypothetical protein
MDIEVLDDRLVRRGGRLRRTVSVVVARAISGTFVDLLPEAFR